MISLRSVRFIFLLSNLPLKTFQYTVGFLVSSRPYRALHSRSYATPTSPLLWKHASFRITAQTAVHLCRKRHNYAKQDIDADAVLSEELSILLDNLVNQRAEARKKGEYDKADSIRSQIDNIQLPDGFEISIFDKPKKEGGGSSWKLIIANGIEQATPRSPKGAKKAGLPQNQNSMDKRKQGHAQDIMKNCSNITNLEWKFEKVNEEKGKEDNNYYVHIHLKNNNNDTLTNSTNDIATDINPINYEAALEYELKTRKFKAAVKRNPTKISRQQLKIIYEDDTIIVVNKPSGVLCVPDMSNNTSLLDVVYEHVFQQGGGGLEGTSTLASKLSPGMGNAVATKGGTRKSISKSGAFGGIDDEDDRTILPTEKSCMTVHRLDMDTSGIVVFGKKKSVVKKLHGIFAHRHGNVVQTQAKIQKEKNKSASVDNNIKNNAPGSSSLKLGIENIEKQYEALVCGHIPENIVSGIIDLPLQRDHQHSPFMRVCTPESGRNAKEFISALQQRGWRNLSKFNPKASHTKFTVLSREYYNSRNDDDKKEPSKSEEKEQLLPVTRLLLTPITGRTHQLRVHCAAIGFPIVGDPAYGVCGDANMFGGLSGIGISIDVTKTMNQKDGKTQEEEVVLASLPNAITRASQSVQQKLMIEHPPNRKPMCLVAKRLCLPHPITNEKMEWIASTPF